MKYLLLFWLSIVCCVVQADIVYLTDGSEVEGMTRKTGDRVIVELPDGQKKSFSESDVLYIAQGPLRKNPKPAQTQPAAPAEAPASTQPATQPAGENVPQTQPTDTQPEKPGELAPVKFESSEEAEGKLSKCAQNPADMLYGYLRRKMTAPTSGIEDLINTARVRVHDHLYKIGPDWVKPEDFERKRDAFEQRLTEIQGIYKEASKLSDKDPKEAKQKQNLIKNAQTKLQQAAASWQDPLMRWFLMGVAAYNCQDYNKAIQYFHICTSQAPWVAAFWQGLGDTMMALNRHEDAMYPYMMAVETTDDKSYAMGLLKDALQKTPGTKFNNKPVVDARRFVQTFSTSVKSSGRPSSQRQTWLLPGKTVSNKTDSIPFLPFDMLTFRQGVAVPVTMQAMLVGADVVKNADVVVVRLREWLYATAKVETFRNEPIAILWIQANIQLTPTKISAKTSFKRGQPLTVITADISPAMSTSVRDASVTVREMDTLGNVSVSTGLLPGEGTSPVLDSSGELTGFLAGKLETDKDAWPDRLLTITGKSPIARKLMRYSKTSKNRPNQPAGIIIGGQTFAVFAIGTEKIEKK